VSPFRLEFVLVGIAAGLRIRSADPVSVCERRGEERGGEGRGRRGIEKRGEERWEKREERGREKFKYIFIFYLP
jgi:hypothetical protein